MLEVGHTIEYAQRFVHEILAQRDAEKSYSTKRFLATNTSDTDTMAFPNAVQLADCKISVLLALSRPRVILMGDLLSAEECEALIAMARPELKRAKVVDEKTGEGRVDHLRISASKNCSYGETPVVAAIEARISALFGHPITYQEQLQVMHYPVGGYINPIMIIFLLIYRVPSYLEARGTAHCNGGDVFE